MILIIILEIIFRYFIYLKKILDIVVFIIFLNVDIFYL